MKVLVCGGRDYQDQLQVYKVLDKIHAIKAITTIIHGAARGADSLAGYWATDRNGISIKEYPADWDKYGKSAGYKRNSDMLNSEKPDLVVAFPGGKGTEMMVQLAKKGNYKVLIIGKEHGTI